MKNKKRTASEPKKHLHPYFYQQMKADYPNLQSDDRLFLALEKRILDHVLFQADERPVFLEDFALVIRPKLCDDKEEALKSLMETLEGMIEALRCFNICSYEELEKHMSYKKQQLAAKLFQSRYASLEVERPGNIPVFNQLINIKPSAHFT